MIHSSNFVWLGQGDSLDKVPCGAQWYMTQLWEAEWESGREIIPVGTPALQHWVKAEMRVRWPLPGILQASLALLCSGSSPPWENIGLQTLQVQTSRSLQVVRRWALLPCLALTRPLLGLPGLCCTSRLYGSHSRRYGFKKLPGQSGLSIFGSYYPQLSLLRLSLLIYKAGLTAAVDTLEDASPG